MAILFDPGFINTRFSKEKGRDGMAPSYSRSLCGDFAGGF